MKRNDMEFKAEIYRRYDIHKKKQRKKYITAGSSLAAVMLCAVLTLPPMLTSMTVDESAPPLTQIENATIVTTTESIEMPDAVTITFGEKKWEFSDEDAEAVMEYLQKNRKTNDEILTYGTGTTTTEATTTEAITSTDGKDDAVANGNYLLTASYNIDSATVITAESATTCGTQSAKNEKSKRYILTEIYWDFQKLEVFLDDLQSGKSKEGDTP